MDEINNQVSRIEKKLQQLFANYQQAQKEILRLKKENAGITAELEASRQKIESFEQQINSREIIGLAPTEQSKIELEKRINNYLKDIEKCLALLNAS